MNRAAADAVLHRRLCHAVGVGRPVVDATAAQRGMLLAALPKRLAHVDALVSRAACAAPVLGVDPLLVVQRPGPRPFLYGVRLSVESSVVGLLVFDWRDVAEGRMEPSEGVSYQPYQSTQPAMAASDWLLERRPPRRDVNASAAADNGR